MQPSDTVMTPKRIFLSVLVFGVAGLLLFLYLQVQFEEQHTGTASTLFFLFNYIGHFQLNELQCLQIHRWKVTVFPTIN